MKLTRGNSANMMLTRLLSVLLVLLSVGCVSAEKARFYHPKWGVVDGNNDKLSVAGRDCIAGLEADPNKPVKKAMVDSGLVLKDVNEHQSGNVLIATAVLAEGYRITKHQSSCMNAKGWHRVESVN